MEHIPPTYEEYVKATAFAKYRYKYGVYIQLIALVLFLFLIYYTVTNIEEMKANPADYAEKKLGVFCHYPPNTYQTQDDSYGNFNYTGEG